MDALNLIRYLYLKEVRQSSGVEAVCYSRNSGVFNYSYSGILELHSQLLSVKTFWGKRTHGCVDS